MNTVTPISPNARPHFAGQPPIVTGSASQPRDVDASRVLRNTYALLSMTC